MHPPTYPAAGAAARGPRAVNRLLPGLVIPLLLVALATGALAQTPATQPSPGPTPSGAAPAQSEQDRIRDLIKGRARAAGKPETRPAAPAAPRATGARLPVSPATATPGKPSAPPPTSTGVRTAAGAQEPTARPVVPGGVPATQPDQKAAGCGHGAGDGDLPFPAEDQPQPKLVLDKPNRELTIWRGEEHEFIWEIKNGGAGPLAIRLKGG